MANINEVELNTNISEQKKLALGISLELNNADRSGQQLVEDAEAIRRYLFEPSEGAEAAKEG